MDGCEEPETGGKCHYHAISVQTAAGEMVLEKNRWNAEEGGRGFSQEDVCKADGCRGQEHQGMKQGYGDENAA